MIDNCASKVGEDEPDPVYEAAAEWVARLSSPDASDEDRDAFEVWRAADPAHAEAYAEMDELWRKLGHVPDPRQRRPKPKGLASIAAAALLVGGLAYQFGLVDRVRSDLWSNVGDIEHARLADGSRVDLNTGTGLVLRFSDAERGVEILRGEAAFDVVPDPARPFVVRGDGLSVRAVGTRFYVRADATERPVGVMEGRVEVATRADRVLLGSGEAARRAEDGRLSAVRSDVERAMAWRDGRLVFSEQPLAAVLAELERYRRGRIVLLDTQAGERLVTGTFDPRNTDDALDVLGATMGVRITHLTPLLVLVRPPG